MGIRLRTGVPFDADGDASSGRATAVTSWLVGGQGFQAATCSSVNMRIVGMERLIGMLIRDLDHSVGGAMQSIRANRAASFHASADVRGSAEPCVAGGDVKQGHEAGGPTTDHPKGCGPAGLLCRTAGVTEPWFQPVAVADDLGEHLALAWSVRTDVPHDLVPDACVDVVWRPDGSVVVCGPEVEGWTFQPFDGADPVGVRFRPGHAPAALGTAMDEIRDQRVLAEDLLGADGRHLAEELGDLPADATAQERITLLQNHIRRWVR